MLKLHGGESRNFRLLKMAVTCQNPSFQVSMGESSKFPKS